MAKQLDGFDFKRGRNMQTDIYPMEWLNGEPWELTKDDDFPDVKMTSFYSRIQSQAKRYGMKVRSRKEGVDTIIIQAYPDPEIQRDFGALDPQDEGGPLAQKEDQ